MQVTLENKYAFFLRRIPSTLQSLGDLLFRDMALSGLRSWSASIRRSGCIIGCFHVLVPPLRACSHQHVELCPPVAVSIQISLYSAKHLGPLLQGFWSAPSLGKPVQKLDSMPKCGSVIYTNRGTLSVRRDWELAFILSVCPAQSPEFLTSGPPTQPKDTLPKVCTTVSFHHYLCRQVIQSHYPSHLSFTALTAL